MPKHTYSLALLLLIFFYQEKASARSAVDSLKSVLKYVEGASRVDVLNELSREYEGSDFSQAESYAAEALSLAEEINYTRGRVKSYLNFSYLSQLDGEIDEGISYIKLAASVSHKAKDNELLAECYYRLAGIFFTRGKLDSAEYYAKISDEFAVKTGSEQLISNAHHLFGIIYGTQGKYEAALEYFFWLLDYNRRLKKEVNVADHLKNIGHTYSLLGKYDEALRYLAQALEIQRQLKNKNAICWILSNMGSCYSKKQDHEIALAHYQEALALAEENDNPLLVIVNLDHIGQNYLSQKEYDLAEKYLLQAFKNSTEYGSNSHTIYILGGLADLYFQTRRYTEAIRFGLEHLSMAESEGIIQQVKVGNQLLAGIYAETGNFKLAFQHQQRLMAAKDTLFNVEKSKQAEELIARYETTIKEQQIETLSQRNKVERLSRNGFAGLFIVALVLGGALVYQKRLEARKNRVLLEKEEEVGKIKSRFFANITHEFRTPLTLMFGPIERLKNEIKDENQLRLLDMMRHNSGRLLNLINQLLELSKLEAKSIPFKVAAQNIITMINGIAWSFESLAQERNIDLRIVHRLEEVEVCFDREKIEKTLVNLLSNAFKFNKEKGWVAIETCTATINGTEWFECRVSDSGKGIAPEDLPHVFDRFFQSSKADDYTRLGAGIGLSLSREFVLLHHGMIEAKNNPGGGAVFTFWLPLGKAHFRESEFIQPGEENFESISSGDPADELKAAPGKDAKWIKTRPVLLLIEDNAEVRNYIVESLQEEYNVLEAPDGEEGVDMACKHMPDLVISDVMMPKKDGYEVCGTLKTNELTSHIPVILLTAKAGLENKLAGLEMQADDYITKPFVHTELLVRIKNLIESREKLRRKYRKDKTLRPSEITVSSIDTKFLEKLAQAVEENMADERFGVESLGGIMGLSRSQLHRKMTALLGQGPNEFIRSFRLQRARDLLSKNAATASEIAYQVGFGSPSYFTKCFREEFGFPPGEIKLQKNK